MTFLPAVIGLALIFSTLPKSEAHDYHVGGWQSASDYLRSSMDPTKEACRDFYGYACGSWIDRASREGSEELRDAENKMRDLLLKSLEAIDLNSTVAPIPNYQRWLRVFYDQCMDMSVLNETELLVAEYRALQDFFGLVNNRSEQIEKTSPSAKVWIMAGLLEQSFLGHFLAEADVDWIFSNCTKKSILKLSPPTRPYLKVSKEQLVENSRLLLAGMGLPFDDSTVLENVQDVKTFEDAVTALVDEVYEKKATGDEDGKMIKVSDLPKEYPNIDWTAYLSGLFPDDWVERWNESNPLVLIVGDHYFKSISTLIDNHQFGAVQDYAYWKLISQIKEFYISKTAEGISSANTVKSKQGFCYELLKEFAPGAVARMYFDALKADVVEWRNDVDLLAHNMLSAFRIFVSGQDWLDAQDKMSIVHRINGIRIDTGIPVWLANDTEVNSRTPRFDSRLSTLQNVVSAHRLSFMDSFRPLITPNAAFKEPPPQFTAGAMYLNGKIEVNLGQLLPPLYHHNYPLAVKYGMLGWLLGHELMHGFDEASLLEGPTHGQHWLRKDVEKMFHHRKRCMVKQYSAYCYKKAGGKCLSGVKTVNENIGDIEGLKIAYMAYKFVTQTVGSEPPIPKLVKLTNDQAFFISAAQLHCGKEYDFIIANEPHPPNKVRVEQSMRNFPVFAQAFRCRKGGKFSPIRTCSLWGRFVSPNQCEVEEDTAWEWPIRTR